MSAAKTKSNTEDYLRMYTQMVRIRAFEDQANQLYLSAKMPGLTHMYSGEEAVAVGICEALTKTDKITSTHRGHGHCVAKGARPGAGAPHLCYCHTPMRYVWDLYDDYFGAGRAPLPVRLAMAPLAQPDG